MEVLYMLITAAENLISPVAKRMIILERMNNNAVFGGVIGGESAFRIK